MTQTTRTPNKTLCDAYKLGLRCQGVDLNAEMMSGTELGGDVLSLMTGYGMTHPVQAFFAAGTAETAMPSWVEGWRYGGIPESGTSYNHRDERPEWGVSVMAIDGEDDETDGTFELFHNGRPRVRVAGWLITHKRGSDGEPLLTGAVAL